MAILATLITEGTTQRADASDKLHVRCLCGLAYSKFGSLLLL
jgi:hypothetical protein